MITRSGARRSNANPKAQAVDAHGASAAPFRRVQKRLITGTKCKAGADASRLLKGTLRVFAVSDLHTHHRENLAWVQQLSTSAHQQDVLIVAGDISDDLDDLRVTLTALKQRFALVFFCPGNHELWVTEKQRRPAEQAPAAAAAPSANSDAATAAAPDGGPRPGAHCEWDSQPQPQPQPHGAGGGEQANVAAQAPRLHPPKPQPQPQQQPGIPAPAPVPARDSAEKLAVVMAACEELGVLVGPARLGRLRVVPLLAWHHKAFDREPDIPGMPRASPLTISDYARCVWPERIISELRTAQYCEAGAQQPRQQDHQQQYQQHQQTLQQPHQLQQQLQQQQVDEAGPMLAIGSGVGVGGGATSGGAGAAAFGADWGEGGHGSSAVAAWFDALNDAPRSWRTRGRATGTSNSNSGVSCISNARTSSSGSSSSIQGDAVAHGGACRAAQQPRKQGGGRESPPERDEDAPSCLGAQDPRRNRDAETHHHQQHHQQHQQHQRPERRRAPPDAAQGEARDGVRPQEQKQWEASRTTAQAQTREHEQTCERVSSREDGPSCAADVAVGKEVEEEERLQQVQVEAGCGDDVISFSHFLPLQELLPEKRYLTFPNLAKAVGSTYLGERLRRLRPHVHVFGHTHFAWDAVHEGVRYVQAPLAYPSERRYRLRSLVMAAAGAPEDRPGGGGGGGGGGRGGVGVMSESSASSGTASAIAATATGPAAAKADPGVMVVEAEEVDDSDEGCLDPRAPSPAPPPAGSSGGHAAAPSHPQDEQQAAERRAAVAGPSQWQSDVEQDHQEGRSAPWPSSCDPRDARWLPLCIYRAEYTVRLHPRGEGEGGSGGSCSSAAAAAAEADLVDARRPPPPTAQLLLRCCAADAAGGVGGFQTTPSTGALDAAATPAPANIWGEVQVLEWQSEWCPEQAAMWSSYYKRNARRPHELQLAPWVAERYSRRLRRNIAKLGAATAPPPPPLAPAAATTAAAVETAATFANAAGAGRAALSAGGVGFAPGSRQGVAGGGDDGGAGSIGAAGGVGPGDAQALQSDCVNAGGGGGGGGDGEATRESEVEETELE